MGERHLLVDSESLTEEEQRLRAELELWCEAKLAAGARPIPLMAAVTIVANDLRGPHEEGKASLISDEIRCAHD